MIKIIEKFFDLYKNNLIDINWNKTNMSFNFTDGPKILSRIIDDLNGSVVEDESKIDESDVVNAFFAIMSNRISEYYNEEVIDKEINEEISSYIDEFVENDTLTHIRTNIFLDNNIYNNRLKNIKHEILTKRSTDNISKINGYTTKIIFETVDNQREENSFLLELKLEEIEEVITELRIAKENIEKLIEGKE